jgi:hypothetical protein
MLLKMAREYGLVRAGECRIEEVADVPVELAVAGHFWPALRVVEVNICELIGLGAAGGVETTSKRGGRRKRGRRGETNRRTNTASLSSSLHLPFWGRDLTSRHAGLVMPSAHIAADGSVHCPVDTRGVGDGAEGEDWREGAGVPLRVRVGVAIRVRFCRVRDDVHGRDGVLGDVRI